MQFNEYSDLAKRTINHPLPTKAKQLHSLFGITGEIGEIVEIINSTPYSEILKEHKNHILSELGDMMWFINEWCIANGFGLATVSTLTNLDKYRFDTFNSLVFKLSMTNGLIQSVYQKDFQGHEVDNLYLAKLMSELIAIVQGFVYSLEIEDNTFSIENVMDMNVEKLKKRYPNGFEEEKSLNRAEGDI